MQELLIHQNPETGLEIFTTIQGEGIHAGSAAIFIRLQGCDVHCSFCDEKDTWLQRNHNAAKMKVEEVLTAINKLKTKIKRVVITGGEPTQQKLELLIRELMLARYQVSIETACTGAFSTDLFLDYSSELFISFSPKDPYSVSAIKDSRIWKRCNEIKFVLANNAAKDYVSQVIIPQTAENQNIFLVPDWFNIKASVPLIWELVELYPERLKMGFQAHKFVEMR